MDEWEKANADDRDSADLHVSQKSAFRDGL